jgi:hypothetical protein
MEPEGFKPSVLGATNNNRKSKKAFRTFSLSKQEWERHTVTIFQLVDNLV